VGDRIYVGNGTTFRVLSWAKPELEPEPVAKATVRKWVGVDLDGTLLPEGPARERFFQPPDDEMVAAVNRAYAMGHRVTLFSARGWNELPLTEEWLRRHGVKYHDLLLDKPPFDILVDDRTVTNASDLRKFLDETV
jgi:hypothetical protein